MTNQFIQLPADSTGKKVDTEELTVGANTVQRERMQIAGSTEVQVASILNASPSTEYGLVVRNIPSGTQTISGTITANAGTGDFLTVIGHTRNEAFKESSAIGGELDDITTVAATEGNVSPVRITFQRALHINLRSTADAE